MPSKNTIVHINDDLKFLIACCQTQPTKDETTFILSYLNTECLNFNALISLANQHGILPVVYKTIKHLSQSDNLNAQHSTPNSGILTELKAHYMSISQRNMLMSAELIRIMKLFKENNIEALSFKGPTLSQMTYGDIILRQYSDLDIFVHKEDIVKSAEILLRDNYTTEFDIKYFSNQLFLNVHSDSSFYHKNRGILIEIHWTLFRKRFSNKSYYKELWEEIQKVYINQYPIQTFNNENLLVYLCMHGSKHTWERIEWIADIHQLIITSSDSLNWEKIFGIASKVNGKKMLKLGLLLTHDFFQTSLPSHILVDIKENKKIQYLKQKVISRISIDQSITTQNKYRRILKDFIFYYQLNTTFISKILFIPRSMFSLTSKDIKLIYLRQPFHFLYYILRPLRIIYTLITNITKTCLSYINRFIKSL